MKTNKKLIFSVMIISTLLFSVSAISVSAEDVAASDSDKFDLNLSFPADAKEMVVKEANGGNKLQDAVLILNTGKGKVDYTVSRGQFYLFDPNHPHNPKYLQVGDKWVKVDRVKNFGPANCSKYSSAKREEAVVVKTAVAPQPQVALEPKTVECDPVVTIECVDPGSHKVFIGNPHTRDIYIEVIPVAKAGDDPQGKTYPRDIITMAEYRKVLKGE